MASENTAPGVLDKIEHDARALEDRIRIEQSEIEVHARRTVGRQEEARREEAGAEDEAREDGAVAKGSVEGQVYFDIATEALGGTMGRLVKDVSDFVSDADPGKFSVDGKSMATMESSIKKMKRAPGFYAADGSDAGTPGMSLTERCNLAASSITSQGECNLTSWAMKQTDMPSTQMQQNLVFSKELASRAALDSVARARMIQAPMMGMGGAGSRAATLTQTLANGPTFNIPDDDIEAAESAVSYA